MINEIQIDMICSVLNIREIKDYIENNKQAYILYEQNKTYNSYKFYFLFSFENLSISTGGTI